MQYDQSWVVRFLDEQSLEEFEALPADIKAKFRRIAAMIQSEGLDGQDGIGRAIYIAASGRQVVVVRTFIKKTQQTPRSEIDLALARARRIKSCEA